MYIVLHAKAYCKAGTAKIKHPVFDFMMDISAKTPNMDEKSVFEQIIFYLKSIQTTD
jgi:hypothetical protein